MYNLYIKYLRGLKYSHWRLPRSVRNACHFSLSTFEQMSKLLKTSSTDFETTIQKNFEADGRRKMLFEIEIYVVS